MAAEAAAQEEEWLGGAQQKTGSHTRRESGVGAATVISAPDEEELKETVFYRLESLGYRVGLGIVER